MTQVVFHDAYALLRDQVHRAYRLAPIRTCPDICLSHQLRSKGTPGQCRKTIAGPPFHKIRQFSRSLTKPGTSVSTRPETVYRFVVHDQNLLSVSRGFRGQVSCKDNHLPGAGLLSRHGFRPLPTLQHTHLMRRKLDLLAELPFVSTRREERMPVARREVEQPRPAAEIQCDKDGVFR